MIGTLLTTTFIGLTTIAHATTVEITDTRCVSATIDRAHESITAYDGYSQLPGAKYEMKVGGIGTLPLLTMVKSQGRFTTQTATQTDALVWVVLQPSNLTNAAYYPKLLIHCTSAFDAADHFKHACTMVKEKTHYGLQNFDSALEVTANAPQCASGQTLLDYKLVLDSNSKEVTEIKNKVTEPAGPVIGPILGHLFNEESFFRSYYVNFYESWAKAL